MKQQILLVDDQVSFCHHIKAILEQEGYEVVIANNADQALQKLSLQTFDILLTDMKMPGPNGLDLFKIARKTDRTLAVPADRSERNACFRRSLDREGSKRSVSAVSTAQITSRASIR